MNVRELIEQLAQFAPHLPVVIPDPDHAESGGINVRSVSLASYARGAGNVHYADPVVDDDGVTLVRVVKLEG